MGAKGQLVELILVVCLLLILVVPLAYGETDHAPYLRESKLKRIEEILATPISKMNAEKTEIEYRALVRRQMLADLRQFYLPENEERIQIALPVFVPHDAKKPGPDGGFGLHVVKRLELPLPNGRTKTLFVNEHWGENPIDGGIFLPDEVRLQTQVKDGERFTPGSHSLYLFEMYRIGWTGTGKAILSQRSAFKHDPVTGYNLRTTMRVPISAPLSCRGCHASTQPTLVEPFLTPGKPRNYETIVQDDYFKLPLEQMNGFKEYVARLKGQEKPAAFIENVESAMRDKKRFAVPALLSTIDGLLASHSVSILGEDSDLGLDLPRPNMQYMQGVYFNPSKKRWFMDAVETLSEGKYVWWEPKSVIP